MVFFTGKNGYTCTRGLRSRTRPDPRVRVDPHTSNILYTVGYSACLPDPNRKWPFANLTRNVTWPWNRSLFEFSKQHTTTASLRTRDTPSFINIGWNCNARYVRVARRFTVGAVYTVFRLSGSSYSMERCVVSRRQLYRCRNITISQKTPIGAVKFVRNH